MKKTTKEKYFFDTTPVQLPTKNSWIKTFVGKYLEEGSSVQQTSDGGCIITGYTNSSGTDDYDVLVD